jgi:FG-GAP-like repeat
MSDDEIFHFTSPRSSAIFIASVSFTGRVVLRDTRHQTHRSLFQRLERRLCLHAAVYSNELVPSGLPARDLEIADFNEDGLPDILASATARSVRVILSRVGDTFAPPLTVTLAASGAFFKPKVADLNADGHLDLLAVSNLGKVCVALGDGLGAFSVQPEVAFSSTATVGQSFTVADFNADGTPDVAAFSTVATGVVTFGVATGVGDGTFGEAVLTTVSATKSFSAVTPADVDSDGWTDLVLGTGSSTQPLAVLKNNQLGSFAAPVSLNAPAGAGALTATEIVAADITGDGALDLLYASNQTTWGIQLYTNDGDGQFSGASSYPTLWDFSRIAVADINEDGLIDVVAGATPRGFAETYLGSESGLQFFQPFPVDSTVYVGDARDFALADVNGDGHLDYIAASSFGSTPVANASYFQIAFGNGTGRYYSSDFFYEEESPFALSGIPTKTLIDLDADGYLDAVQRDAGGGLKVAYGLPDGRFEPETIRSIYGMYPADLAFGDYDGDGRIDFAYQHADNGLRLSLNKGRTSVETVAIPSAGRARQLAAGDLNEDGVDDLYCFVPSTIFTPSATVTLISRGDGTFDTVQQAWNYPSFFRQVELVDVDADGHLDALALLQPSGGQLTLALALGVGDGTFLPGETTAFTFSTSARLLTGDLEGDGTPEIFVNDGPVVKLYRLNSSGAIEAVGTLSNPANSHPASLSTVADFNSDGNADVMVVRGNRFAELHLGNGDGSFKPLRYFDASSEEGLYAIASGDVTRDGIPDAVVFTYYHVYALTNISTMPLDAVAPSGQFTSLLTRGFERVLTFVATEPLDPASVAPGDVVARNLDTGESFTPTAVRFSTERRELRFVLPAAASDGRYAFELLGGAVSDHADNPNAQNVVWSDPANYLLAGDADGDRAVTFNDLLTLARHFGSTGQTFSNGNFNYDSAGVVDFNDLLILAQRYGKSLFASQQMTQAKPATQPLRAKRQWVKLLD